MPQVIFQEATSGFSVTIDGRQVGMVPSLEDLSTIPQDLAAIAAAALQTDSADINMLNIDQAFLAREEAKDRRDVIRSSATVVSVYLQSMGSDVEFTFDDKEERDMFKQVMDTMIRNELPLTWHPGGVNVVITPGEYDEMCLKMVQQGQAIHVAYLADRVLIDSHDFDAGPFDFPNLTALGV